MNEVFEDLRAALFSVWHRRWLALGVAWGVCVLGWLVVALIPNSYESEARMYVQTDDALTSVTGIKGASKEEIDRVRQTLASKNNLEKVVRSTRLGEDVQTPRDMANAIESLTKKVTVNSEQNNLFELKAEIGKSDLSDGENAALAQSVVQKLIDIFREENIAGSSGDVAETIVFLDRQLEDRKRELEAAEQRRLAFEAENPDLIGGTGTLSAKRQQLNSDLRDVQADLAAAQSSLAAINGQLAGTPRTIITPGAVGGARQALANAQSQLASMQAGGKTASHPDVIAIQKQISALRGRAANENPTSVGSPNPAYSSLVAIKGERQANVQAMLAREAALQSEVSRMMASAASEPAVAAEANRISRDYEVLKDKYDELLQKREDVKLRIEVETNRSSFKFEVIDPPTLPRIPSAPNRPLLLIGVLIAGIAAGVGAAFAIGQLRSTFATTGKLERALDLPVVGAITQTMTDAARELRSKRMRMFYAGSGALAGLCVVLLAVEFFQRSNVA